MKVFIKALNSCVMRKGKLRQYVLYLLQNGHNIVLSPEECDAIFVWSCAFRSDVRDNCLQQIKQLKKQYDARLIVGGCLPDIDKNLLLKSFQGDIVSWRNDVIDMRRIFGNNCTAITESSPFFSEEKICDNAAIYRKENLDADVQFHDEFVKLVISEGCNHECSYCSERLAFPPYRSFPLEVLVSSCEEIVKRTGEYVVVLLADSLGEYGRDLGIDLAALITAVAAIDKRITIALNNMNPTDFILDFDKYQHLVREGIICHVNLPIQSASDRVLKRMNRAYCKDEISRIFTMFAREGLTRFDTHVIIGFPGERGEDIDETIEFIFHHGIKYVLASQYMETLGMDAAKLDEKCNREDIERRLGRFAGAMEKAGIICNIEKGNIMGTRLERINKKMGVAFT